MPRAYRPSDLTEKPADRMTEDECRREYRAIRARSGMPAPAFDAACRARIVDASEADPAQWVRAARAVTERCDRCNGSGIYRWGPCVNGICRFSGTCFACQGKGKVDDSDRRRNWGYWNHHAAIHPV